MRYGAAVLTLILSAGAARAAEVRHSSGGYTTYGEWSTEARAAPDAWTPGDTVRVSATLVVGTLHLELRR